MSTRPTDDPASEHPGLQPPQSAALNQRTEVATTRLIELMARLRNPQTGCAWDVAQTFQTIAPYTIEEAYEVADAIARTDFRGLREELGDLLFQVFFHARMAEEQGLFDFADVAAGLDTKMRARHPHVFGDAATRDAAEQTLAWEDQKAAERAAKAAGHPVSVLADVPINLPALMRAEKLTKRAARIGFDWPDPEAVLEKLTEELAEVADARTTRDHAGVTEEIGDLLFVVANLARKLNVDPEEALRQANAKFTRRFQAVEAAVAARPAGTPMPDLEGLEALWVQVKRAEKPA